MTSGSDIAPVWRKKEEEGVERWLKKRRQLPLQQLASQAEIGNAHVCVRTLDLL